MVFVSCLLARQFFFVVIDLTETILLQLNDLAFKTSNLPVLFLQATILSTCSDLELSMLPAQTCRLLLQILPPFLKVILHFLYGVAHSIQLIDQSLILLKLILKLVVCKLKFEAQIIPGLGRLLQFLLQ